MALWLDVGPDDLLRIGGDMFVSVERKSGSRARLKIMGPAEVELVRNAKLRETQHRMQNPPRANTGD